MSYTRHIPGNVLNAAVCFEDAGFEALTAVVMESSVFWDITPCSQTTFPRNKSSSIFSVEDYAKQETGVKKVASRDLF
jgi:hypothetical protein